MKNNGYNFTFIVGYRHSIDRLKHLRRVLDWINSFSGSQVILVEQDKHSKISQLNLNCKHIFIKNHGLYNRSWSFNVGLEYTKAEIIIFGDSDIVIEPNQFINSINDIRRYEMVSPYNSVLDLTEQESMMPLQEIIKINRTGRGDNDNQKINICGGISIFRKDSINKIGGWDERFMGWGGEDDFQALKVKKLLDWKENPGKCYHFYHLKQKVDQEQYKKTLSILNASSKLSDEELIAYIKSTTKKIGLKNKFENEG